MFLRKRDQDVEREVRKRPINGENMVGLKVGVHMIW
jgi:hypothetical protein